MSDARRRRREGAAGVAVTAVLVGTVAAWMAGWSWLAVPAVLAILGLAAAAVGVDTRRAGDWRRVETN